MNEKVVGCESQTNHKQRKMHPKRHLFRAENRLLDSVDLSAQVRISVDVIRYVTADVICDDCNVNLKIL